MKKYIETKPNLCKRTHITQQHDILKDQYEALPQFIFEILDRVVSPHT